MIDVRWREISGGRTTLMPLFPHTFEADRLDFCVRWVQKMGEGRPQQPLRSNHYAKTDVKRE
jgi:hypothetical protein